MTRFTLIALTALTFACQNASSVSVAPETFGAALSEGAQAQPLAKVLKDPKAHTSDAVVVEGVVRQVCQAKGCWMELASGTGAESAGARITFKDYGFFVPMDCVGATARVEGVLQVNSLSKEQVDHMESEGATVAGKAADGTAQEVRLVATGVELYRSITSG
ncbi:MAG: DUF4920 domain-containing protein [Myxococcota bacterium]